MNVKETVMTRRSIKHYDPDYRMSADEIKQLLSLATYSPTAFNIQNWRFVVVSDEALREEIKKAAWNQSQVTDASLLIILCADLKAWEKEPIRYWVNATKEAQEYVLPAIDNYYRQYNSPFKHICERVRYHRNGKNGND